MEDLASLVGFGVSKLPASYLGLPLGAPFKTSLVWDVIEERFHKRLALWKEWYRSLVLLKSALSNFPIYFISPFMIQRRVY